MPSLGTIPNPAHRPKPGEGTRRVPRNLQRASNSFFSVPRLPYFLFSRPAYHIWTRSSYTVAWMTMDGLTPPASPPVQPLLMITALPIFSFFPLGSLKRSHQRMRLLGIKSPRSPARSKARTPRQISRKAIHLQFTPTSLQKLLRCTTGPSTWIWVWRRIRRHLAQFILVDQLLWYRLSIAVDPPPKTHQVMFSAGQSIRSGIIDTRV